MTLPILSTHKPKSGIKNVFKVCVQIFLGKNEVSPVVRFGFLCFHKIST